MSLGPHRQSSYKLRRLPKCNRCKSEFILVSFHVDGIDKIVYMWECVRCHKTVNRNLLKEEDPSDFERMLHEKFIEKKIKKGNRSRKTSEKYH